MNRIFSDLVTKQRLGFRAARIIARLRELAIDAGAPAEALGGFASEAFPAADPVSDAVPLDQAAQLPLPGMVCAHFDHYASGEGRTLGILIRYFADHQQLQEAVLDEWGEYFSQGASVQPWSGSPPGFEGFIPMDVTSMLADPGTVRAVQYVSKLHYNFA